MTSVGDLLIEQEVRHRENGADVITDTVIKVLTVYPGEGVVIAKLCRRFCYVRGYPELGRDLPASGEVGVMLRDCRPVFATHDKGLTCHTHTT